MWDGLQRRTHASDFANKFGSTFTKRYFNFLGILRFDGIFYQIGAQPGTAAAMNVNPNASPATFEDKRKENFDKGQEVLEKRRQSLIEEQRKIEEERKKKEKEEAEAKEKAK